MGTFWCRSPGLSGSGQAAPLSALLLGVLFMGCQGATGHVSRGSGESRHPEPPRHEQSSTQTQERTVRVTHGRSSPPEGMVKMDLVRLVSGGRDQGGSNYMVVLGTQGEGQRFMALWVGDQQALALQRGPAKEEEQQEPNPSTHDLMGNIIRKLGARLIRVEVESLDRQLLQARVVLALPDGAGEIHLEARPDDSLVLIARNRGEIYVSGRVLDAAGFTMEDVEDELEKRRSRERKQRPVEDEVPL